MELISDLRPEALIESPPTLPPEKPAGPRLGSALLVSAIFYAVTIGVTIPIVIVLMAMKKPLEQIMLVLAGQLVAWPAAMLAGNLKCKRPWRESYAVRGFSLRLIPGVIIGCFGLSFVLNRLASAIPMRLHQSLKSCFFAAGCCAVLWRTILPRKRSGCRR